SNCGPKGTPENPGKPTTPPFHMGGSSTGPVGTPENPGTVHKFPKVPVTTVLGTTTLAPTKPLPPKTVILSPTTLTPVLYGTRGPRPAPGPNSIPNIGSGLAGFTGAVTSEAK